MSNEENSWNEEKTIEEDEEEEEEDGRGEGGERHGFCGKENSRRKGEQ